MNCEIALDINKGNSGVDINKYGAILSSKMISSGQYFNESTFSMEKGTPITFNNISKEEKDTDVLKSFFLTNSSNSLNSKALRKKYGDNTVDRFLNLYLNTTEKDLNIINGIFGNSDNIISTLLTSFSPIIVEDENFDPKEDPTRQYITLTNTIIKKLNTSIDKGLSLEEKQKKFNSLLRIFTASALQRGFSVHIKFPMNGYQISQASKIYNRINNEYSDRYFYWANKRLDKNLPILSVGCGTGRGVAML